MSHRRPLTRMLGAAAMVAALAGCEMPPAPVAAPAAPEVTRPSAASLALSNYYRAAEQRLLARGLLRRDGGGPDTPITRAALVANFERIALYDEYAVRNGRFVAQQTPSRLRRWAQPVRMRAVFSDAVPAAQEATDRANLARYAERLSRLTGHPISVTQGGNANYHVLFLDADSQRAAEPLLRSLVPGIDPATVASITGMDRYTYCSVYAFSDRTNPDTYVAAIAVIKAEHPDLLRLSCLHEELAQGLGLANDSPAARPSIFNDDEEFALLTTHDEILLSILYDPRLRPGMTPAEARPIVTRLAAEKLGGES